MLIEEQNRKQYQWPLGRVFRIIKGPDGQVRTVLLRSKNSRKILKPSKCIGKEGAPAVTSTVIFFMQ